MPKPKLHPLSQRKLKVEFAKLPEKHKGACQYSVQVEGIEIGTLYREYEEGARIAYGCVGGSWRGGYGWFFDESDELRLHLEENNDQSVLWFMSQGPLDPLQKKAKKRLENEMDEPGTRGWPEERWWVLRVNCFLKWLEGKTEPARGAQQAV